MNQPIYKNELSPSGQDRSQPLSRPDFDAVAAKGHRLLSGMEKRAGHTVFGQQYGVYSSPEGQAQWSRTKHEAYQASRSDWGGATFNPRTGRAVDFHEPDKHAVTVKTPGQETTTVPHNLNEQQFGKHMDAARKSYRQLRNDQHYLGVFHDSDQGRVDIDPVVVTGDRTGKHRESVGRERAQQIAAASHALGGAYHFASGNGVWPPHVAD